MECSTSLSITNSRSLLKLMSIKSVMPTDHLILCRPLLLLPSGFPSIRVFSVRSSHQVATVLEFWNWNTSPSNEYSGLIFFRIDCFNLAVQGTPKSLLQHHSLKASILWCSSFFVVQLYRPWGCKRVRRDETTSIIWSSTFTYFLLIKRKAAPWYPEAG